MTSVNLKDNVKFMSTIMLINRMMLDEWSVYIYSGFDKGNGNEYYRLGIREQIERIMKRIKNAFAQNGFTSTFEMMDNDACDHSDYLEDTVKAFKARIETKLNRYVGYDRLKPLVQMVTVYVMSETAGALTEKLTIGHMYTILSKTIDEYSDRINVRILNNFTIDNDLIGEDNYMMLYNGIIKMVS